MNNQYQVNQTYNQALLSDAAYINFTKDFDWYSSGPQKGEIKDSAKSKFNDRGFSDDQFFYFKQNYKIVDHLENTNTGLSITIFETADIYGYRTLAFRGTEFDIVGDTGETAKDLFRDMILGAGFDEFTGGLGQDSAIENFLIKNNILDANGNVASDYYKSVNITGHSLGGHLSLMTALNIPELVNEVYTFNGAGLSTFDSLINLYIMPFIDAGHQNDLLYLKSNTYNVYSEPGLNVTRSEVFFDYFGESIPMFIEKQGGDLSMSNHSMQFLTDSLSVVNLISTLDPTLSISDIDDLLKHAANREIEIREKNGDSGGSGDEKALSLDVVMAHLAAYMGGDYDSFYTVNDADAFAQKLVANEENPVDIELVDINWAGHMKWSAVNDQSLKGTAIRYALLEASPFYLVPGQAAPNSIFEANNPDNKPYQFGQYEDIFWEDRESYILLMMDRNKYDKEPGESVGEGNVTYIDYWFHGETATDDSTQGKITIKGENANENTTTVVFGSERDDGTTDLIGQKGSDRIYSLEGNDSLFDDAGVDHLFGGANNDHLDGVLSLMVALDLPEYKGAIL